MDIQYGNNANNGLTPQTPVQTIANAYTKLSATGTMNANIIVIMGTYTENNYWQSAGTTGNNYTDANYNKPATLTGIYEGVNYHSALSFIQNGNNGTNNGKFLSADTVIEYMTLNGNNGQLLFYLQGRSMTMGDGLTMNNYPNINMAGGTTGYITTATTPDFHIIGGYFNYNNNNSTTPIPYNNSTITIKSGVYARVIAGNRNEVANNTSGNVLGSASNPFNVNVIIDIKRSTKQAQYGFDVNLLVGGQTDGSIYTNNTLDVRNGNVGRILGGSIGNTRAIAGFPENSFFGSSAIKISGGTIQELYGGSLGRNQSNIYFYGTIDINISGGVVSTNLYGAGAGGVTGYSDSSTDTYKSLGQPYGAEVNINMTGGTVNGNIYGAGYRLF